jgi:hypothetical protein
MHTIQRTGRAKRAPEGSHFIVLGNRSPAISEGRCSRSNEVARARLSLRSNPRYSPFGVSTVSSAATATPCERAKPSAALVGLPSSS